MNPVFPLLLHLMIAANWSAPAVQPDIFAAPGCDGKTVGHNCAQYFPGDKAKAADCSAYWCAECWKSDANKVARAACIARAMKEIEAAPDATGGVDQR